VGEIEEALTTEELGEWRAFFVIREEMRKKAVEQARVSLPKVTGGPRKKKMGGK
jgi:hypothetical protein